MTTIVVLLVCVVSSSLQVERGMNVYSFFPKLAGHTPMRRKLVPNQSLEVLLCCWTFNHHVKYIPVSESSCAPEELHCVEMLEVYPAHDTAPSTSTSSALPEPCSVFTVTRRSNLKFGA